MLAVPFCVRANDLRTMPVTVAATWVRGTLDQYKVGSNVVRYQHLIARPVCRSAGTKWDMGHTYNDTWGSDTLSATCYPKANSRGTPDSLHDFCAMKGQQPIKWARPSDWWISSEAGGYANILIPSAANNLTVPIASALIFRRHVLG